MESLANKYRPKDFEDVVEQSAVVSILKKQLETNNIRNCYLFTGSAGCVDKDTEFFDGTKWKKISDYQDGDHVLQYNNEGEAQLVKPTKFIKIPCNSLYEIKTKYGLDMCISDEHRVIYKTSKGNLHEITGIELIHRMTNGLAHANYKFITHFKYSGQGINLTDTEIKLMCATICDGTFKKTQNTNFCTLNLKKERKIIEARNLLIESGIHFVETPQKTGYVRFYYQAPRKEKEFEDYWYNCTNHQLQVICDNILKWDGHITSNRKSFSNTSLKTINFLQFAFSSCGYRATIRAYDRIGKNHSSSTNKVYKYKSIEYILTITPHNEITLPKNLEYKNYKTLDGYKYCFNVPSTMWVMRRNGHILITGNCGKTSLGRIIANKLNPDITPIEIDAASNNSIDNIRQLIEDCQIKPLVGYYKSYILDECHSLSNNAWQGLLKLIEEPPKNVVFIFCTTDPQKIPETILSRVQRFDLQRISLDGIVKRLKTILEIESKNNLITYEDTILEYIAKIADGGLRNALSILDKCLSYSYDLNIKNVLTSIGRDYYEDFIALTNYIVDYKDKEVLELIENIYNSGKDIKQFIKNYSIFLLDACKVLSTNSFEYTQIPNYYIENVKELVNSVNKQFMLDLLDSIIKLVSSIRWETSPKQVIEMHLLLLCRK